MPPDPSNLTEYRVYRLMIDDESLRPVGPAFDARNPSQAVENAATTDGTYVAIPTRSLNQRTVTTETKTIVTVT